jgi:hypothetical protein
MSKEKAQQTCVICLEVVEKANLTKLDGCIHIYCFECIDNWTKQTENSCPLCKEPIKQLIRKDSEGVEQIQEVLNLRQG